MDGQILVTVEELTGTAGEFNSQGSQIASLTSEMVNTVTSLSSAWEGEAAQAYIAKFKGLEDDIQKIIRMISEHVSDLEEMANQYQSVEQQNLSDIETLSSDVIV